MSRNGAGVYSLPTGNPVVTGTTIQSTWANNTLTDIATALTGSVAANGETPITANLPMGGFKHTGVAVGAALTDYARLDQAQNATIQYLSTVAGTDTITATVAPVPAAYVAGQVFRFIASGTNTGAVTLNISSLGAKSITKNGLGVLEAGDIITGSVIEVVYDGTQFQLKIFNQASPFRNVFINGDDSVNQINNPTNAATGTAVTVTAAAAVASVIDRWYAACTGQNITAQQVTGPGQFKYAMKLIAGATGPTTTLFGTRLEGKDCYKYTNQPMNIQVGTFGDVARTVTWTAYYANTLDNFSTKVQIATGTISATSGANVYHVQFNAGANAGNGICIEFTTGALTNSTGFQTYYGRQLEQVPSGAVTGTAFEFLPYETQLKRCQRYLPVFNSTGTSSLLPVYSGSAGLATAVNGCYVFPVPTRIAPTGVTVSLGSHFSVEDGVAVTACTAVGIGVEISALTSFVQFTVAAGLTQYRPYRVYANNAAGQIYFTGAELW